MPPQSLSKPEPALPGPAALSANGHPLGRTELERVAQKMYTQNLALAQTNRTLSILRAIDLLILESRHNLQQLSTNISRAIIDSSPYAFVAILSISNSNDRFLSLQGFSYSTLLKQSDASDESLDL